MTSPCPMFTPSSCYSAQESAQRSALKDSDRRSALKDSDQQSALKDSDRRSALRESLPTPHYTQDTAHYERLSACLLSSAEDTDHYEGLCAYSPLLKILINNLRKSLAKRHVHTPDCGPSIGLRACRVSCIP